MDKPLILSLDAHGIPHRWISWQQACFYYAKNLVAACRHCNGHKRNRIPEESGMQLLYAPYVPNKAEYLILTNRRILADQMEFLKQHVASHSRLVLAPA